jgi:hypothetical protein
LRTVFDIEVKAGLLHECIASADQLRLVVTTNYDDLIERALEARWSEVNSEARKPWIVVDRGEPGVMFYRQPNTLLQEVDPDRLRDVLVDPEPAPGNPKRERPVLFKMHGSLNRQDWQQDFFMITEEHYLDFLGRPKGLIPSMLSTIMRSSSFLFLGYGLRDWNIRLMLRKLMKTRGSERVKSWAVVKSASLAEKRLWGHHDITIFEVDLNVFARELKARL